MLKSEIYQLEELVAALLENSGQGGESATQKWLTDQVRQIRERCADLKAKWVHELFSSAKEQVIARYVQFHQAGLTHLSNTLSRNTWALDDPASLLAAVITELDQLLIFLKDKCYRYFDLDYKLTEDHCRRLSVQLAEYREALIAYNGTAIDRELVDSIAASVLELGDEALSSGLSYRQADHLLQVLRMVHPLIHRSAGAPTDALAITLYRQNFNTLYFLNWYREYLASQISRAGGKREKEAFIARQLKMFAAVYVDPEKALETELPGTDTVMTGWLRELTESGHPAGETNRITAPLRLPLTVSAPPFALFLRIFSQAGCFPDTNVSRITRFFTQHFTTKKQNNISHKSFARAFYSLDQTSAAVVRDYLQKMINYLNKTYFP